MVKLNGNKCLIFISFANYTIAESIGKLRKIAGNYFSISEKMSIIKGRMVSRRNFLQQALNYIVCFIILSFLIRKKFVFASTPELLLMARKTLTPELTSINSSKPIYFSNTNNLRRKTASPFLAKGIYLTIEGYVTDLVGAPMENVNVKIWQANHFGYYNHLTDQDDEEKFDHDFNGSGWAVTDNLGYYSFTTIMPGYYGKRVPHVHFLLESDNFNSFETEMIFPNYPIDVRSDPKISLLSDNNINNITCKLELLNNDDEERGKKALFNIKVDVLHPVKRY